MKLYKYVDTNYQTFCVGNVSRWMVGATNSIKEGTETYPIQICSDKVYHAFIHPLIGELALKIWGQNFPYNPLIPERYSKLLEVEGTPIVSKGIIKVGCRNIKVVKELQRPLYEERTLRGERTLYFLWWVIDTFLSNHEEEFWEEYFKNPRQILEQKTYKYRDCLPPRERAILEVSVTHFYFLEVYIYRLLEAFPTNLIGHKDSSLQEAEIETLELLQGILDEIVMYDSQYR